MTEIGIAVGLNGASGAPLSSLRTTLDQVAEIGFTHAEISVKTLAVSSAGQLIPQRLEALRKALDGVSLRLTIHGTNISSARAGNLMDITTPNQRRVVEADLAVAAAIGAEVMVIHSGSLRDSFLDDDALALAMANERDALQRLGDQAGKHNIRIAVENIDPVGTYIARRAYGLRLDALSEQVERIDHPHVGVCLDVGHAFLAAAYLGYDYLAAVTQIAPQVVHLHLSDNFGRSQLDDAVELNERLALGDGDLHLLPGWGSIPLESVFSIPYPQRPHVILELRPHFAEHFSEALATTQSLVSRLPVA